LSEKFDSKLILELKVSYALIAVVGAMHLGAAAIVAVVPLPWPARAALWAALLASAYLALAPSRRTVAAVELDGDGSWALRLRGDEAWHACELTDRWVHPFLVILRLHIEGRRRAISLVIPADAAAAEPFRRLRARLRMEPAAA